MLSRSNAIRRRTPSSPSLPSPSLPTKSSVISLAEAQARPDIRYRTLRLVPRKPVPSVSSVYTQPKPILDFESHMLETTLIPRSMAALFDEIKYRGL